MACPPVTELTERAWFRGTALWHDRMMRPRFAAIALAVALPLSLGACGQVQDRASSAASDAASQAKSKVASAARDELRRQICQRVADGQVSAQDKQVLSGLVSSAESSGVPSEITTPLRQIASSGDQVPVEAANKLKKACTSSAPPG
ncbi:MAG: hypothetical protein QOF35_612 [Actinomycetota bacterium]|nr:hypothetical protein [Actinomycetota bacterium]